MDEGHPVSSQVLTNALTNLARLTWIRGDFELATQWHRQCLDEWTRLGDSRGIISAQINMQQEAHRTRDYARSIELLEDNLRRAVELGDKNLLARSWLALGNTAVEMRCFEDALDYYEKSLNVSREVHNSHRSAHALNNLGNLALLRDQPDLARHHLMQALTLFEAAGAKPNVTGALLLLARLERRQHDDDAAERWLSRAWAQNPEETYNTQRMFLEHAHIASNRNDAVLAATLLGFVQRQRETSGALNFDVEQEEFDALVAAIRAAMTESAYAEAITLGRSLDLSEAASRVRERR
jgi:tetratricopeptide (TPR) repeat protein